MAQHKNLTKALKEKKSEFYTQLTDIAKELKYYKHYFKGKCVLCNCDDPEYSNFWKYFHLNFYELGLSKLISTHYEKGKISYKMEIVSNGTDNDQFNLPEYKKTSLKEDGDFRSEECIEILKEADIVVTNPPFPLFREYIAQLIEYKKKFIIIGNVNAITYKEFFPLIRDGLVWMGASIHSGDREFRIPEDYPVTAAGYRIDEYGNKYIRIKGVRWWTNLDYPQRHEDLILYKNYDENKYPKYENFNAINVGKTEDIPCDYNDLMGVPITFLDKYNPDQFEIIGLGIANLGLSIGVKPYKEEHKKYRKEVQKRGAVDGDLYLMTNGIVDVPYARIIIKKKER